MHYFPRKVAPFKIKTYLCSLKQYKFDMETKKVATSQAIYSVLKNMAEDKRAMKLYIQEKGTLDGFSKKGVKFAKPL